MTPAEHYRRAEELLAQVEESGMEWVNQWGSLVLAQAEVHARLAAIPSTVAGPLRSWNPDKS